MNPTLTFVASSIFNNDPQVAKQMILEIHNMNKTRRVKFILNGMNCNYVYEWNNIYRDVLNFIHIIYDME